MYQYQCPKCGRVFATDQYQQQVKCPYCNEIFSVATPNGFSGYQQPQNDIFAVGPSGKSRGIAGLLAILVGGIGIHYFYCGKTTAGVIFLLVAIFSCGILAAVTAIVALIQGIMMLTMTQQEFENKYVYNPSSMPLF